MSQSTLISFSLPEETGSIRNFFYATLIPEASKIIEKFRNSNHGDIRERFPHIGGILRLTVFNEKGKIDDTLTEKIGRPRQGKIETYHNLSLEKVVRTVNNYLEKEHNRSDQSLDETEDQYAGGIIIRIGQDIVGISFSGLPQWFDKALCLAILNSKEKAIKYYYGEFDGIEMFKIATAT